MKGKKTAGEAGTLKRGGRPSKTSGKSSKAKRVGRPKGGTLSIDSQAAIIDQALTLFASANYVSVSTKDIANAAGVNTALIYYYFGSKDELFRRTIIVAAERAIRQFRELDLDDKPLRTAVTLWIDCHKSNFLAVQQLARISVDYASQLSRHQGVEQAIEAFHADTRYLLSTLLLRGQSAGELRTLDAAQATQLIATSVDGIYHASLIFPDDDALAHLQDLQGLAAAVLFDGRYSATSRSKQ